MLEVLLAMAILAVICGTIYQFTATTVRASNIALRIDTQDQTFAGLRRLLDAQFSALPASQWGALVGMTEENNDRHHDAIQLVCPAGNPVLSPDARGLYRVTLGLEETPKGSGHYTLVMEREPWLTDEDDASGGNKVQTASNSAYFNVGSQHPHGKLPSDTLRLLPGVRTLEISYFDPRLNSWQDRWMDQSMLPSLVRVRLAMENSGAPYEFIERIPGGGAPRGLPTLTASGSIPSYPSRGLMGNNPANPGAPNIPNFQIPPPPPNFTIPPPPPNFNVPSLPPPGSYPVAPR